MTAHSEGAANHRFQWGQADVFGTSFTLTDAAGRTCGSLKRTSPLTWTKADAYCDGEHWNFSASGLLGRRIDAYGMTAGKLEDNRLSLTSGEAFVWKRPAWRAPDEADPLMEFHVSGWLAHRSEVLVHRPAAAATTGLLLCLGWFLILRDRDTG